MNLTDQLQELRENILRDTSDLIQGSDDNLWSDETLVRYIRDAEYKWCRRTLMLRDSTTPTLTQVRLRTGVFNYPLDLSILGVISARYAPNSYDMDRSGHGVLFVGRNPAATIFDPTYPYKIPPGAPLAYCTDETLTFASKNRVTFSVFPVPTAVEDGQIIHIRVVRLPVTSYDLKCPDRQSEIPDDYELDVLEWAAYRAQRTFDADAGAPTSADAHKKAFDEAVDNAIQETKRKAFQGMNVLYGQNGFRWAR